MAELALTSESFQHGDPMPMRHALEGGNLSLEGHVLAAGELMGTYER
jgi:phosphatidylethanolamine-binding protein (PEBP) family uncharacterized protein